MVLYRKNPISTMQPPEVSYFFDLPVSEVSRSVCDALRILYHGSLDGIFGTPMNDRVNLNEVKAIKIAILHLSSGAASDQFEYNLVYYSKELSDSLWDLECREKQAELRALTQRVSLNSEKSHLAKRILNSLFIKPDPMICPVYFAKYEGQIPHDNYVPLDYHRKLPGLFDGYLMRCNRDFPLIRSLFHAQNIDLAKRHFSRDPNHCSRPIITYTLRNTAATHDFPPMHAQSDFSETPRKSA